MPIIDEQDGCSLQGRPQMKWKSSGLAHIQVGGRCVPVKTVRLRDRWGQLRRFRVRTVHLAEQVSKRSTPCWGQLAKEERELIGVLVFGAHRSGQVLVRSQAAVPYLFVSLDAVSLAVRRKLLVPIEYDVIFDDEALLAREREPRPWYVAAQSSRLFHQPGCPMARRINEKNKVVFETREEAFAAGFRGHRMCIA